ncbi:Ubiquitin-like protein [Handroanthus impetiginosus]|uniref:Ubiquitin-like protein n=1 Tax=Handroanthus impetiginosus TaxID=429701 RepID=A0A2G9GQH4_9LAMI|nr:Ubiquitin-like protein [Handroanthus impetiginosus]
MAVKQQDSIVTIRIQYSPRNNGGDSQIQSFRTRRDDPLRRIFLDFCDSLELVYGTVRVSYDGRRVLETETPDQLEMDDRDIIDAFTDQSGGCGRSDHLFLVLII